MFLSFLKIFNYIFRKIIFRSCLSFHPNSCLSFYFCIQLVHLKLQKLQKPRPRLLQPPHHLLLLLLHLHLPRPQLWAPFPLLCPLCHLCQHMLWTLNQVSFNETDGPCHVRTVLFCIHALDLQLTRLIIVRLPAGTSFPPVQLNWCPTACLWLCHSFSRQAHCCSSCPSRPNRGCS